MKDELSKVAQKWNEFERRLREVKADSGRQLILLKTMVVKQAHMDKVLRGFIT